MTLDECEDMARRVALGLPPSDFGSTRAIQAFAQTLRAAILNEREACAKIADEQANHYANHGAMTDVTIANLVAEAIRARSNSKQ